MGLFSYYAQWIRGFSDTVARLIGPQSFPLSPPAIKAFNMLRSETANFVVVSVDENLTFELETDASDIAISAVLNQHNQRVAFFSRILSAAEKRHPSVEKEACAITEAVRYWRYYLTNKHIIIKTDQASVKFMFKKDKSKIKNDKIHRWRLELSCYHFDIIHKPGRENIVPDTLTRMLCSNINCNVSPTLSLYEIHNALCHPGIIRLFANVRSKNLPFSIDEVRRVTEKCGIVKNI